jgi:hypothetical protein
MQNFDHNIGFREKRQFFSRKLAKIAENCDHNIAPRLFEKNFFPNLDQIGALQGFQMVYIQTKVPFW